MAFLATESTEALYGGAAGGGKTDALLMAALQYVDVPGYSAIIFRRTYPQLVHSTDGIIPRANEWLAGTDAEWREAPHTWTFPSGAQLQFGHMQQEKGKHDYQSAAYQFIGFDELTSFTQTQYQFMFSRLRKLAGSPVPTRVRSATNPGNEGHLWVRKRFVPDAYLNTPKRERFGRVWKLDGRTFVPARLEDNLALDQADYIANMENLDPVTRLQYREGDWETDGSALLTWEMITDCTSDCLWPNGRMPAGFRGNLFIGIDVGRSRDHSVIWTWEKVGDVYWTREIKVLSNVPFAQQKHEIRQRLGQHVVKAYIDKGFNPQLTEELEQEHRGKIEGVQLGQSIQGRLAQQLAVAFGGKTVRVPDDHELFEDLMLVSKASLSNAGTPKVTTGRNATGHADRFWAAALGYDAAHWVRPVRFGAPMGVATR